MSVTLRDEQWEQIVEAVDALENLETSLTVIIGLPDKIHVEALRETMPVPVGALRALISEVEAE